MKNLLLFFFLLPVFVGAQNLVLNPSFEDTVECPSDLDQIYNAIHWNYFRNSPDYFHKCSSDTFAGQTIVSVPQNLLGYQYAFDGEGYGGIISYLNGDTNHREIIGGTLSQTLIPGQKYYSGMWICGAEIAQYSLNKIGISFSTVQYDRDTAPTPINNSAKVYALSVLSDTLSWMKVSGSFVADSAYKYIMVGNFFTDANSIAQHTYPSNNEPDAYYYVDAVYLSTDSLCCFTSTPSLINSNEFLLFPNPANKFLIVKSQFISSEIFIYNIYGEEIIKQQKGFIQEILDVSNLDSGLYLLIEKSKDKILKQKFLIQK